MFDLMAVAYQTDLTRVATFMMSRELSQRTYPQIGVSDQHHGVSHHGNDPEKIAKVARINAYHARLFATFLEKLRSTPDGDGSVLDHSLIFYGGGMGNPNQHATGPLPMVIAGGGVSRRNRHLQLPPGTPVGNLWLTVAHAFDNPLDSVWREQWHGRLVLSDLPRKHENAKQTGQLSFVRSCFRGERRFDVGPDSAASVVACTVALPGRDRDRGRTDVRLIEAVKAGNVQGVRTLLAERVDVNARDADGTTALHWAVRDDAVDIVVSLIRAGASANVANRHGVTPLVLAATNGSAAVIDELMKAGADPNAAMPEGQTALMAAARTGRVEAVEALLRGGADPNVHERRLGETALMWAAAENHAGAVAALIRPAPT